MSEPELPAFFRAFESTQQQWSGTYWWGRLSGDIPDAYREAAHRLFNTMEGNGARAERVLLPILYTYRHAIETLVKQAIMASAVLRIEGQDQDAPTPSSVEVRLRRDVRHKLAELRDLLNDNLLALQLEPVSDRTSTFLGLLADLDPSGNAFRFAQLLPDVQVSLDLPRLMSEFDAAYGQLLGTREYLVAQVDDQRDWVDFLSEDFE